MAHRLENMQEELNNNDKKYIKAKNRKNLQK
jgi:hypothetical protein